MNKQKITRILSAEGMAWAVSANKVILPEDGFDARPTYHIHPDASYPHQNEMMRFASLREIADWLEARESFRSPDDVAEWFAAHPQL